jgi:hypothetical protein
LTGQALGDDEDVIRADEKKPSRSDLWRLPRWLDKKEHRAAAAQPPPMNFHTAVLTKPFTSKLTL